MSREKDNIFDKFIERVCSGLFSHKKPSITNAAKALGMTRQSLQHYKTKETLPEKQAYKFAHDNRLSIDWLLYGEKLKKNTDSEQSDKCKTTNEVDLLSSVVEVLGNNPDVVAELYVRIANDEPLIDCLYGKVAPLAKKLETIYKEGNINQRGLIRGMIDELYEEVATDMADDPPDKKAADPSG